MPCATKLSFLSVACTKNFTIKVYLQILFCVYKLPNLRGVRVKFITQITSCRIMPPTRTARTRAGDGNSQTNVYFGAAIFRQLTIVQLQELCRRNGLSALGRRTTLENRLKNADIASAAAPNDQPVNGLLPSTSPPVQQRTNPNAFTEEQITEIKRLVEDSVAAAARDITREAARAPTGVLQSQAPSSQVTPSAQAVSQDAPGGAAMLGPQEQQHPLHALQSLQPNDGSLPSTPCSHGAPFQEIPMNYVKEIQSGEFFTFPSFFPKTCHCMTKRTTSRCHLKIL